MKLFRVLLNKELVTQLFGDSRGKKRDVIGTIVSALISLAFLALFVFLFVAFHSKFTELMLEDEVLIIFVALGIVAQIILSVARTSSVLYGGADAKVILPLPISNFTMLAAKLVALWIKEIVNSCFFVAPVMIAYGIMGGKGPLFYVLTVIAVLISALFVVAIAGLIAPLFYKIRKIFAKKGVVVLIVSLVFFAGLLLVYSELLAVVSDMIIGDRLRFIFNKDVADTLRVVSSYLFFARQIGDFLGGDILGLIIILLTAGVVAVGAYFVSSHFYLAFLKTSIARQSKPAKTHKNAVRSAGKSLIFKELTEVFRDPQYLFSYLSVLLTLPVLCYLTVGVLNELITKLLGSDFLVPFAVLILVMYSCVCNTFAGDVISREESRIMIVKTIPVSYKMQVGCKVGVALVIALLSDIFASLVLLLTGTLGAVESLLVFLITAIETVASVMHLVAKDINNPSVKGNGAESANVSSSVVRALVVSFVLGGICFAVNAAYIFQNLTTNSFVTGIAGFMEAIGGLNGFLLIIIAVCIVDGVFAFFRMTSNLEERMRRIKI